MHQLLLILAVLVSSFGQHRQCEPHLASPIAGPSKPADARPLQSVCVNCGQ